MKREPSAILFFWSVLLLCLIAWPVAVLGNADRIYRESSKSVVVVVALDKDSKPMGAGSGFLVREDGAVVTNYHVVNMASAIAVRMAGRTVAVDGLLHVDSDNDIAIIKMEGTGYPVVRMGDSTKLRVGEKLFVIGSPQGLENTISEGILSGLRRVDGERTILQMTAAISPGSSGGPVFNNKGEVVGIATFLIADTQNLNFAMPVNLVRAGLEKKVLASPVEACKVDFRETAACFFYQGVAYGTMGEFDRAADAFQRSLDIDAGKVETHVNLAVAYANMGRYGEAAGLFKKALTLSPNHPEALLRLGTLYLQMEQYAEARSVLKKAVEIKPDDPQVRYSLAVSYGKLGLFGPAAEELRESIRLAPDAAEPHGYLGTIYNELKMHAEAAASFKAGIRLEPDDPRLHMGLGRTYVLMGDRVSALEEYKILRKLKPEMADTLFDLIYQPIPAR